MRPGSQSEGGTLRGLLAVLVLGVLALCLIGIATLALNVRNGINSQATANSDNSQWTLSQLEVEFLNFKDAIVAAKDGTEPLDEVRLRFDIVYSRISMFVDGKIFAPLRQSDDYNQPLLEIRDFMDGALQVIDGSDATLQRALPGLLADTRAISPEVRALSLAGLALFASDADAKRQKLLDTLITVGTLTALMIIFLLGLVALLLHFDRLNRARTREVELSLNRIKATIDTALDAVLVTDLEGHLLEINPAAERIFGYTRSDFTAMQIADLVTPAPSLNAALPPDPTSAAAETRMRLTARHCDQTEFPVELSITQSENNNGTIFICFIRDLSTEVAAEQALISARDEALAGEKAKADLLAVMSHEMRTPLNGLLGTLELLQDSPLTPSQQRYLGVVQDSSKLLLQHVNDVLDITRLEKGRMQVYLAPVSVAQLLQDVISNQSTSAERRQNRLLAQISATVPDVLLIDAFQVKQILLNLVSNAIKFTLNDQITLAADYDPASQVLTLGVKDNGIGIAAKDLDRVFQDFVVLDASYARVQGGTGLGLAITRRIATALGGTISVTSREGEGSLFTLQIPATPPADDLTADLGANGAVSASLSPQSLTILVVEDNAVNRFVVRELLMKQGHSVQEAANGKQGLALAGAHRFDLILMDISMPLMDGIEATKAIRSSKGQSASVPIIALTAHARSEEVARFKAAGMQEVLIKPISAATLRDVLRRQCPPLPQIETELDSVVLDELFQTLGPAKAQRLLSNFTEQTEEAFTNLLAAPPQDPDHLRQEIHKLCGSCAVFGAVGLLRRLRELETLCRSGQPEAALQGLHAALPHWQQTRDALQAVTPGLHIS